MRFSGFHKSTFMFLNEIFDVHWVCSQCELSLYIMEESKDNLTQWFHNVYNESCWFKLHSFLP